MLLQFGVIWLPVIYLHSLCVRESQVRKKAKKRQPTAQKVGHEKATPKEKAAPPTKGEATRNHP